MTTELSLLLQLFEMLGDAEREDDNGESLAVMEAVMAEYMAALNERVKRLIELHDRKEKRNGA